MTDSAAIRKQLKIKTDVVKRFVANPHCQLFSGDADAIPLPITRRTKKDLVHYRAELEENETKLVKLREANSNGGDSFEVRNAVRENTLFLPLPSLT